jgi:hypothetical protein
MEAYPMFKKCLTLAALFLGPTFLMCQVVPAARGGAPPLTAGGFISYYDAAYASNKPIGFGGFIDWSPYRNFGIEAEGRWLMFNTNNDFREYSYLAGPRYGFRRGKTVQPYAKVLLGGGVIDFPYGLAYGRYFVVAPGGGADFRVNRHWRVRADYEYQIWPSAPGIPGIPSSALKPNGVSVGFVYRFY